MNDEDHAEACRSSIPPDTIYAQVSGASEKGFWQAKFHADCHAAWGAFVKAVGYDHSDLGYYLADEMEAIPRGVVNNALNAVRDSYPEVVARLEAALHERNNHE